MRALKQVLGGFIVLGVIGPATLFDESSGLADIFVIAGSSRCVGEFLGIAGNPGNGLAGGGVSMHDPLDITPQIVDVGLCAVRKSFAHWQVLPRVVMLANGALRHASPGTTILAFGVQTGNGAVAFEAVLWHSRTRLTYNPAAD